MKELSPYESSTMDRISSLVAVFNEVDKEALFQGSDDDTCLMRYSVYFVAHWQFKIPISSIQKYFNHRQHGTVINGLKRIDQWRQTNKQIKESLDTLVHSLDNVPVRKAHRQLSLIHHPNISSDGSKKASTNQEQSQDQD